MKLKADSSNFPEWFEYIKNRNYYLIRRFENCGGHSPIAEMGLRQHDTILGWIGTCETWEDVPEVIREMIEEAEANKLRDYQE